MLREITLGQYYPADSAIHRLDPRVKLFATLLYVISLFTFRSIAGFVVTTIFLAAVIVISKVPFGFMVKGLRMIVIILLITALFNLFLTPGRTLVEFWIFRITEEGLVSAVKMAVRLVYLILGTSLMTLTTTPNQLTDGMERGLRFLKAIRIPVHEIAKAMVPLLVPLFISAFRRANDLAMAMEARCYHGGEGRTKMKPLRYRKQDGIAYTVVIGYFAVMIAVRVLV